MTAGQLKEQLMGIPEDAEIMLYWDGRPVPAVVDSITVWKDHGNEFHFGNYGGDYVDLPALYFSMA